MLKKFMMLASWSLSVLPIYECIIMYGQYSLALGYNVIHSHLENVLAHFECKWYTKKSVPAKVCVECCEEWSCLHQVHPKECFVAIHFGEFCCSCENMGYLLKGWCLVVFMDDGFIQVLWVETYPQLAVCLLRVCEKADPWCGLSLFHDDFLDVPSLSALSQSPPCTQWEISIFCVVLEGLYGLFWCCTLLTCHLCCQSFWGTMLEESLVLLMDVRSRLHL